MKHFTFLLFIFCIELKSQTLIFNFENQDLTDWEQSETDHWALSPVDPIAGQFSLKQVYDSDVSGSDQISILHSPLQLDNSFVEWSFKVRYDYNPSGSNNWGMLISPSTQSMDFENENQVIGYILGVNLNCSDDLIKLWQTDGNTIREVVKTDYNWQEETGESEIRGLKLNYTNEGLWQIYVLKNDGSEVSLIGSGFDRAYNSIRTCLFYYNYTASQDQKLCIDDVVINGEFTEDNKGPLIDTILIESQHMIIIQFNEPVNSLKSSAILLNGNSASGLTLITPEKYAIEFSEEVSYNNKLVITTANDLYGNVSKNLTYPFTYYSPVIYDVIFTEIMADPTPEVKLPECEFVELYNRSNEIISLKNWRIQVNNKSLFLSDISIMPKDYIVISQNECEELNNLISDAILISGLPTLPNDDFDISLFSNFGQLIHYFKYNSDNLGESYKSEGGWSLEMLDTGYPCQDATNWAISKDIAGGTPGRINSVAGINPDFQSPDVIGLSLSSDNSLTIHFSESMDSISLSHLQAFSCDNNCIVLESTCLYPHFENLILQFEKPFPQKTLYTLHFKENITDCSGNPLRNDQDYLFGISEDADSGDIKINEIMYNPSLEGVEYIELFNASDKIIELRNLTFAQTDGNTNEIVKTNRITDEYWQILPETYVIVTSNRDKLTEYHQLTSRFNIIEVDNWNSLQNSGGKLLIINHLDQIIETAAWSDEYHFDLLTDNKGISLERISIENSGLYPSNWHSASESVGFGTPGYKNSQSVEMEGGHTDFTINSTVISPNNDGYNDLLSICYSFTNPGTVVSCYVFDLEGRLVKKVADSFLAGVEGYLHWDGLDQSGNNLSKGFYIVYLEAFNETGFKTSKKLSVLVE